MRLTGNPRPSCPRQEFVAPDDAMLDGLFTVSLHQRPATVRRRARGRYARSAVRPTGVEHPLYGRDRSHAPCAARVLVLASRDPQRFRANGTVYLVRLGELLMAASPDTWLRGRK